MEMSRLTRDGTAEPVSRDQILRRKRRQGKTFFPIELTTSRNGNLTRLIPTLAICDDHTYSISSVTNRKKRRRIKRSVPQRSPTVFKSQNSFIILNLPFTYEGTFQSKYFQD